MIDFNKLGGDNKELPYYDANASRTLLGPNHNNINSDFRETEDNIDGGMSHQHAVGHSRRNSPKNVRGFEPVRETAPNHINPEPLNLEEELRQQQQFQDVHDGDSINESMLREIEEKTRSRERRTALTDGLNQDCQEQT